MSIQAIIHILNTTNLYIIHNNKIHQYTAFLSYTHKLIYRVIHLHGPLGLVVRVVRDVGRGVEKLPYAVSAVGGHN